MTARRLPRALVALVALAALAPARPARADVVVSFLGPARAISHSSSAARDTAVLGLVATPHRVLTGGGEVGLASLATPDVSFRLGFFGMLELESEGTATAALPFPQADIRFWRGLWGYHVAASFDALARRWCDGCALEATLGGHHESAHYTGANSGGPGTDYSDVAQTGDFLMLDVAARRLVGRVDVTARVQERVFLPGRSSYAQSPGVDLGVRWRRWPRVHPFSSLFAEWTQGTRGYPDAYDLRDLTGVILPSPRGDLYLFVYAEQGNRKGLAVYTVERTLGAGVRLAFW